MMLGDTGSNGGASVAVANAKLWYLAQVLIKDACGPVPVFEYRPSSKSSTIDAMPRSGPMVSNASDTAFADPRLACLITGASGLDAVVGGGARSRDEVDWSGGGVAGVREEEGVEATFAAFSATPSLAAINL